MELDFLIQQYPGHVPRLPRLYFGNRILLEQQLYCGEQGVQGIQTYKLSFSKTDSYNFSTVMTSLKSNTPVYAAGEMINNNGSEGRHVFIIDGALTSEAKMVINYEWDESHRITEEEHNRCPAWMFMQSASGNTQMQIERDGIKYTYLRMNWGWGQSYNNTYYLAYSYNAGGSDFAGTYDEVENTYEPNWSVTFSKESSTSVKKIKYLLYGFKTAN